jgi:PhnB protein
MPRPAPRPVPEGMHTLTPEFFFDGSCAQAIEFYQKAFGAELVGPVSKAPNNKGVAHAMMRIGDSNLMMADAWPNMWEQAPKGSTTASLFVYVEDCDRLFERAVKQGCQTVMPPADMFWGDRMGKLKDPYGHSWAIATNKWIMTPEEIDKGQKEFFKNFQG